MQKIYVITACQEGSNMFPSAFANKEEAYECFNNWCDEHLEWKRHLIVSYDRSETALYVYYRNGKMFEFKIYEVYVR